MIKRETIIVLIGVAFSVGVISLLSFFIIWIGFPADNPQKSFKDALGFAVGLFGGLATFGAAVIAAHLFNDWRDSHTAVNRSELSKKIQFALYSLVCLCEYYQKKVIVNKGLLNAKDFPGVSQIFIDSAENIPSECDLLRKKFKDEFEELYKEFQLALLMYERSFNMSFQIDSDIIDNYRFSIGGMLRDLSLKKSIKDLNIMTSHMIKMQSNFEQDFVKKITKETSNYINIKDKTLT